MFENEVKLHFDEQAYFDFDEKRILQLFFVKPQNSYLYFSTLTIQKFQNNLR